MEIYKTEIWIEGECWATFKTYSLFGAIYEMETALVCNRPRSVTIWFE